MDNLGYFSDLSVPIFKTKKVDELLPEEVAIWLTAIIFKRAEILRDKGQEVDYMQVCNIMSKSDNNGVAKYMIVIEQEQPEYITLHGKRFRTDKAFNGKLWVMETWNGAKKSTRLDDHYITLLLPEEY